MLTLNLNSFISTETWNAILLDLNDFFLGHLVILGLDLNIYLWNILFYNLK
jgi:hypothetical protein